MRFFTEIASNRVFWAAVTSWFVAQALKVVFTYIVERRWDLGRFFGLGGMPSSHSSVVCSVAVAIGMADGFYSSEFALAFILACVVMTDAAGVRRAAGQQAAVLNKVVQDMIANGRGLTSDTLKELLGHTPFEVVIGAMLGVLIGILMV